MRTCKAHPFEAHERNMINEKQVAGNEVRQVRQAVDSLPVEHHADLHWDLEPLEIEHAQDGFIKGALGLDDIIVNIGKV